MGWGESTWQACLARHPFACLYPVVPSRPTVWRTQQGCACPEVALGLQQEPVRAVMGEVDRMQAQHGLTVGQEQTMLVWKLAALWAELGGRMVSVAAAPAAGMEGEHQQQAARNQPQLHESTDAAGGFAVLAWSTLVECSAQSFRSQNPATATLSNCTMIHCGHSK